MQKARFIVDSSTISKSTNPKAVGRSRSMAEVKRMMLRRWTVARWQSRLLNTYVHTKWIN